MPWFLVVFQIHGDDCGLNIEADCIEDARELVAAIRQSAEVEGEVWNGDKHKLN